MHLEGALTVGAFTLEVARLAAVVACFCFFLFSAFSGTVVVHIAVGAFILLFFCTPRFCDCPYGS